MTQEEKAKAYDEAKARMHRAYNSNRCTIGFMNEIFPELKESEDEKLRKELLQIAKESEDSFYMVMTPNKRKHLIAWLEKQGEQKPAWSEEDELHIIELESLVKQAWAIAEHENDKETIHKMSNLSFFLKTLKPQPKQEWSEKDNPYYDDICEILINLLYSETAGINKDVIKKDLDWLISIENRYTWKPSDEQMKALSVINVTGGISYAGQGQELINLYQELNKLKG